MDKSIENISTKEIFRCCIKHRKLLLAATIVLITLSIFYFKNEPSLSTASAIFYTTSSSVLDPKFVFGEQAEKEIYGSKQDVGRIYTIAYSTELINYLIVRHHLYTRFGIDSTKEDAYEAISNRIKDIYKLKDNGFEAFLLTVQDEDKYFAAQLANDIVWKIDEMNKNLVIETHKRTLLVYDAYLNNINKKVETVSKDLLLANESYQSLSFIKEGGVWEEYKKTKYALQYSAANLSFHEKDRKINDSVISNLKGEYLGLQSKYAALLNDSDKYASNLKAMVNFENLTSQLSATSTFFYNELNLTEKFRQRSIEAMNVENHLSTLIVLKKAFPENIKTNYTSIWFGLLIVIAGAFLFIGLLIFWEIHKEELKLLFSLSK